MPSPGFRSIAEQVAAHLQEELFRGRWIGTIPGMNRLAAELGVNDKTVEVALRLLETEGLLVGQGAGRRRRIVLPAGERAVLPLRVVILLHEPVNRNLEYLVELQHALEGAGHTAVFSSQSQRELKFDLKRIGRLVQKSEADAWVVAAGSREVLEWFAARPEPAFALFGRRHGLAIAATGPDKPTAHAAATRRLIELGHRRIVLLCRRMRRLPEPGRSERAFLDELLAHGVPTGDFNMPDWEETSEGFQKLLHSLFRVTPPTALILDEAPFVTATLQYLAGRGIRVPEGVSMICTDPDPSFEWCEPSIAHISWDARLVVRRIVRWAAAVSRGKRDLRQTLVEAEFVEGGTIGPVSGA